MDDPETIEEAKKQGYDVRSFRADHASREWSTESRNFRHLRECTMHTVGKKCAEGPCIGGRKNIYFCDPTNGCDAYITVNCAGP